MAIDFSKLMASSKKSSPAQVKEVTRFHNRWIATKDAAWSNKSWLSWFLDNHSIESLVPMGVWKAKKYIVADYGDRDEEIEAMRAAYELGGEEAVVAVLGAVMVGDLPPDTPIPEVPETWNAQQRYRYQEYRDPATRPRLIGVRLRDDD